MKDKRILYVSSEVVPYLPETEIASTAFNVGKEGSFQRRTDKNIYASFWGY
jgi:hypothetical protein